LLEGALGDEIAERARNFVDAEKGRHTAAA
jgi:hypothetical protein